jgi:hypothetical protein
MKPVDLAPRMSSMRALRPRSTRVSSKRTAVADLQSSGYRGGAIVDLKNERRLNPSQPSRPNSAGRITSATIANGSWKERLDNFRQPLTSRVWVCYGSRTIGWFKRSMGQDSSPETNVSTALLDYPVSQASLSHTCLHR